MPEINVRLYGYLADMAGKEHVLVFDVIPTVKHIIEHLGIPHTEIDMILIDDRIVGWKYIPFPGQRVAYYPTWHHLDVPHLKPLLPVPRFILDVHLGKLARLLRLLGFDTLYNNHFSDKELLSKSIKEDRILLTRDKRLLCHRKLLYGHWVLSQDPYQQAEEILDLYNLYDKIHPFSRCLVCNTPFVPIEKEKIQERIPPRVRIWCHEFFLCPGCNRLYWKGSHYDHMMSWIERISSFSTLSSS